jgi:hypothetical protein
MRNDGGKDGLVVKSFLVFIHGRARGSIWGAFPSNRKMKTILFEVPYE